MIEFIAVDTPSMFPQCCVGCLSQKGPLVDTFADRPGWGHVYYCERCIKSGARVFGYFEGKRLDELEDASKRVVEVERDLAKAQEQLGYMQVHFKDSQHQVADLQGKLRDSENRCASLQAAMRLGAEQFEKIAG